MKEKKPPKVLFLDWDKTLSNSLFWSSLRNENHPHNIYADKIEKTLFAENRHFLKPWMKGEYSAEDICSMVSEKSNIPFNVIFDGLKESCSGMEFVSEKIPALIFKIRSKGIKVIVATDNMDTFMRFTVPGMNLLEIFDDFLVSHDIKFLKNEITEDTIPFFDGYLKKNNMGYEEAVLLDDHADMGDTYGKLGLEIIQILGPETLLNSLKKYAA